MSLTTNASPYHPIRAVAIDLDGTLLSPDLTISAENRNTLEKLHAAGVEVILASGRHYVSMLPIARQLPMVRYMVSAQGAYASDVEKKHTLFEMHLPTSDADAAIQFGLENKLSIVVYTVRGIYTLSNGRWIDYYAKLAGLAPTPITRSEVLEDSIFKVVYFESSERLDEIEKADFITQSQLSTIRTMENIFEQTNPESSKAAALKPIIAHLGIDVSELATFGDANNDIPMLQFAGFSVAMDRAWPLAKVAATLVAPDGPPETSFTRAIEAMQAHFSYVS